MFANVDNIPLWEYGLFGVRSRTPYNQLKRISAADTAYAVLAMVDPGRHVPVPTPQATERGRHWKPNMKIDTIDTIDRITMEAIRIFRIRGAIVAIR